MNLNAQIINRFFSHLPACRVGIFGDLILDRYVFGKAHRISREAPIPVLKIKRTDELLGAAGNTMNNLLTLGCQADLIAATGEDEAGKHLKKMIAQRPGATAHFIITNERRTAIKTRYLDGHQQLFCTDEEPDLPLSAEQQNELIETLKRQLSDLDCLILSDYGRGLLNDHVIKAAIKAANAAKVPVLVDPRKPDFSIYEGAALLTPNLGELAAAYLGPLENDADIEAAGRALIKKHKIGAILITRSSEGMTLMTSDDSTPLHIRAHAREVFDVSGAGDTVIAVLAAGFAAGLSPRDGARLANVAAGIVVAKAGTSPIYAAELQAALRDQDTKASSAPVTDRMQAQERVRSWQASSLKVGFTNGCFDILHAGHVSYLAQARAKVDRLVVGINVDDSVKRLKGPERPINHENDRAAVLAALGAVDLVVLFGEQNEDADKADEILKLLRPDIYFKGADYNEKNLPEMPTVRSYNGRVEFIPLEDGRSTTNVIQKMKTG